MKKFFILLIAVFAIVFLVSCDKTKQEKYTVLFFTDGGSSIEPISFDYVNAKIERPDDPVKAGHQFFDWFKDLGYTQKWIFETDVVSENIVLYALWTVPTFTITYELNGGTIEGTNQNPILYNFAMGDITLLGPLKPGSLFRGWFKESDFSGERIRVVNGTIITADTTLYANWR